MELFFDCVLNLMPPPTTCVSDETPLNAKKMDLEGEEV
jgi:hypothetical protein